jgi:hypothetical protein
MLLLDACLNAHGDYFNGLYPFAQNNPLRGSIWTSLVLHFLREVFEDGVLLNRFAYDL